MKKKKDNLFKDLKVYNLVMTNIWQLLTIILIGVLAGYLFDKYATNESINYMAFSIILFGNPKFESITLRTITISLSKPLEACTVKNRIFLFLFLK